MMRTLVRSNCDLNIILITLDSLRSDKIKLLLDKIHYGNKIFFSNMYVRNLPTIYSFIPIFNGVPVLSVNNKIGIQNTDYALPILLKKYGYNTFAFIDEIDYLNPKIYGYGKIFDKYYFGINKKINNSDDNQYKYKNFLFLLKKLHYFYKYFPFIAYLEKYILHKIKGINYLSFITPNTRKLLFRVSKEINSINKKFFIFIHLLDTHFPYKFPINCLRKRDLTSNKVNYFLKNKFNNNIKFNVLARWYTFYNKKMSSNLITYQNKMYYNLSLRYVGRELNRFITKIYKKFPNTLFLITSDHGEGFGEHGYYGHHWGAYHYNEILKVPLILIHPNFHETISINTNISTLDIAPTILKLLNIKVPRIYQGKNIFERNKDDLIKCESYVMPHASFLPLYIKNYIPIKTLIIDNWKFTINKYFKEKRLINLSSDIKEIRNLYNLYPKLTNILYYLIKNNSEVNDQVHARNTWG